MQVVVVPNHRVPVVTHMVWYKVGSADEPAGHSGMAHLLEHLMFKGTDTRGPGEFSGIVARIGGQENAFTSFDYTAYYQSVAKDRLGLVMEMEADRMTNLALTEDQVKLERQVVLEERHQRVDNNPSAILAERAGAVQFLNHPYRRPIIGWEHEVGALERPEVLEFYKQWYAPNNAVLIVAGDVTAEEVRPLAEKYYGTIPAAPDVPRVELRDPAAENGAPRNAARRAGAPARMEPELRGAQLPVRTGRGGLRTGSALADPRRRSHQSPLSRTGGGPGAGHVGRGLVRPLAARPRPIVLVRQPAPRRVPGAD